MGILLLYYLYKHGSAAPASASQDLSGGATTGQLSAAAYVTQAQTFAQTQTAAYQAGAINNQTAANLQATLATVAGEVAVANAKTSADAAVAIDTNASKVSIQRLQSETAIKTTALQGETYTALAATAGQTAVQLTQIKQQTDLAQLGLQTHIYDILASKGKLGGDSTGVATIISGLYGRGPEAIGAQQPTEVSNANAPAKVIGSIADLAHSLFA